MTDISDIFLYPGELREIDREGQYTIILIDGKPGELRYIESYNHFDKRGIVEKELNNTEEMLKLKIKKMGGEGGILKRTNCYISPETRDKYERVYYICSAVPVKRINLR